MTEPTPLQLFFSGVADLSWGSILSSSIAGLSIIIAIVIYLKVRRVRQPYYRIITNTLIQGLSKQYEELEIKYRGIYVGNFSVSKVYLWNSGGETIRREDIAERDQLVIRMNPSFTLLDASLLYQTENSINCNLELNETERTVRIDFDFIDRWQGCIVQVIHTGKADDISLDGTIKGSGKIKYAKEKYPIRRLVINGLIGLLFCLVTGFVLMALSYLFSWDLKVSNIIPMVILAMGLVLLISNEFLVPRFLPNEQFLERKRKASSSRAAE